MIVNNIFIGCSFFLQMAVLGALQGHSSDGRGGYSRQQLSVQLFGIPVIAYKKRPVNKLTGLVRAEGSLLLR